MSDAVENPGKEWKEEPCCSVSGSDLILDNETKKHKKTLS